MVGIGVNTEIVTMVGSQWKAGRSISPSALVFSALVAAGVSVVATRPARADPRPATIKASERSDDLRAGQIRVFWNYNIKGVRFCIGVKDASTAPRALIKTYRCDGSLNQKWVVGPLNASGHRTFKNYKSHLCMGVNEASTAPRAIIKQFVCDRSLNQQWRILQSAPNVTGVFITNRKSHLYLSVRKRAHDAQLIQFGVGNERNQFWRYD
jgi:Ricin-type beta-trefoil lectin domain